MIVADTDVLIDARSGKEPASARVGRELANGTLATTAMTAFELWTGAGSEAESVRVADLLGGMSIFPLDEAAAREAGRIRRELGRRGQAIGIADCLIAGVCVSRSLPLLTRNVAHFGRVDDLVVQDAALG